MSPDEKEYPRARDALHAMEITAAVAAERERWRGAVREYLDADLAVHRGGGRFADRLNRASRTLLALIEAP
jgi:hypothetical protein